MRLLHFVKDDQEYVVFTENERHNHDVAQDEYARTGFELKGAWEIDPQRLDKRYSVDFLPGEGDVYMMDR